MSKRSQLVKMTNEARVLKRLRLEKGISMAEAGFLIGRSDSYISHLENGRMELPNEETLTKILKIYGVTLYDFKQRSIAFKSTASKKDVLVELLNKLEESNIEVLICFAESILKTGLNSKRRIA